MFGQADGLPPQCLADKDVLAPLKEGVPVGDGEIVGLKRLLLNPDVDDLGPAGWLVDQDFCRVACAPLIC